MQNKKVSKGRLLLIKDILKVFGEEGEKVELFEFRQADGDIMYDCNGKITYNLQNGKSITNQSIFLIYVLMIFFIKQLEKLGASLALGGLRMAARVQEWIIEN